MSIGHRNYGTKRTLVHITATVSQVSVCSMDDSDNKDGDWLERGHWLEHHERSASSVVTLTKTETAAQSRGPTTGAMAGDVGARLLQLQVARRFTISCIEVRRVRC